MADTVLNTENTASEREVEALNKELGGGATADDSAKDPTEGVGAEHHDEVVVDHADEDDDEDQRGRADTELANAGNDAEREEIRKRRKQERIDKRNRARERQQNLERQVSQLTRSNQEMAQQIALLSQHTAGAQMARLDEAIQEVDDAVTYFEGVIADSTTKGDGAAVAKATSNLFAAKERAKELKSYKDAVQKQRPAQPTRNLDAKAVNHAREFMAKNKWYGGPRAQDLDSRILSQIDNAVTAEGFDPTGPEYWEELETRAKQYLPHRFSSNGGAGNGGGSGKENSGYNGSANPRGGPRKQPVGGGSGDGGGRTGGEGYTLSAERVKAIKDAGSWDDPKARKRMIDAYKKYDEEHSR